MEAFADLPIVALCDCHELSLLPVVAEVGKWSHLWWQNDRINFTKNIYLAKYTKWPQNIPNGHEIYQTAIKYTKCP
jgi:hypothetical protein